MELNRSLFQGTRIALVANTDWYLLNYRVSLAKLLRELGSEVYLVSPKGQYSQSLREQGFYWIEWPLKRRSIFPLWEILSFIKLEKIYRQLKPHIVHHFTVKPVIYGSFAASFNNIKHIVNSITGLGYFFLRETIRVKLIRAIILKCYSYVLRKPNIFVIFENQDDRSLFIEKMLVDRENSCIIEGVGVNVERFTPSNEPEGIPIVLYAGRFLWEKGLGELIEAARIVHNRHNFKLVLVGSPDVGNPGAIPLKLLEDWVKDKFVEWWGWQDDMAEIYKKCHIVVLPSYREGIPTTLIEAIAAEKPVIATDVPGCREVVIPGVNGILVPPRNSMALGDALELLISDQELRIRMGRAGRKIAVEKFSKKVIDNKTIMLYQSLLESGKHDR